MLSRLCSILFALILLVECCPAVSAQEAASLTSEPVSVDVDLGRKEGPLRPIWSWFGYDEANYTTAANGRRLLNELHDLSPTPVYIRFHHLLTSGDGTPELKWSSTGVYSVGPDGKPVYNFAILDGIFDALRSAGVRPMVEFGFMPKDLAAALPDRHEPYQVHFPASTISGASNNPPRDYARWGELVRAVTQHLVERYGRATVLQWYFEVWNEPDIDYWHASPEDYWKLYDYAVAGVRAALPGARVGGPATTGPGSAHAAAYLEGFLKHVESGRSLADGRPIPLDFISFHVKGRPAVVEGHVKMGLDHELTDADRGFAIVAQFPRFRSLPIILSEADPEGCAACSARQNPANSYRNGTIYPAYTATAFKGLTDLARRRHVDLISMLSWSFEFEGRDYFEGFRSLATNGIDKPILNLFRMLGLMQGDRVAASSSGAASLDDLTNGEPAGNDVDALAATTDRRATVLIWNFQAAATASPAASVTVKVRNLPAGIRRVLVQQYRIDENHSNAWTLWKQMGSPQQPTAEQLAVLQARDGLELLESPRWMNASAGILTLDTNLPANSLSLIAVTW